MNRPAISPEEESTPRQFVLPEEAPRVTCSGEATDDAFRGDWFHSGDLGVMQSDGYVRLMDRAKDVVVYGQQASEEEIIDHVRSSIAHYKAPDEVVFLNELPKNSAGKVQKFELRESEAAKRHSIAER